MSLEEYSDLKWLLIKVLLSRLLLRRSNSGTETQSRKLHLSVEKVMDQIMHQAASSGQGLWCSVVAIICAQTFWSR